MLNLLKDEIKKEASSITKIPEANTTFTTLSKFASSVAIELHRYKREIGRMSKE